MAQQVAHVIGNDEVTSSNLVSSSNKLGQLCLRLYGSIDHELLSQ